MGWMIKFTYDTGDTFKSYYDQEGYLGDYTKPYVWDKLEDAQEALKRMKEHYLWQDSLSTTYSEDLPRPDWYKSAPGTRQYLPNSYSFNAPGNNGEEVWFSSSEYCGYFETLNEVRIVAEKVNDDKNIVRFR